MKIINPGNYIPTIYRFHCARCGCIYEADEQELQIHSDELGFLKSRYMHCPICGNKIPTQYAEIVSSTDKITETIKESETKSESTENGCKSCAYSGTRDDSSRFCMVPGKAPSTEPCDQYKSIKTNIIERAELTKLRVSVKFLQNYCNNHGCKGCPFDGGIDEGCGLVQEPRFWNTDLLE